VAPTPHSPRARNHGHRLPARPSERARSARRARRSAELFGRQGPAPSARRARASEAPQQGAKVRLWPRGLSRRSAQESARAPGLDVLRRVGRAGSGRAGRRVALATLERRARSRGRGRGPRSRGGTLTMSSELVLFALSRASLVLGAALVLA